MTDAFREWGTYDPPLPTPAESLDFLKDVARDLPVDGTERERRFTLTMGRNIVAAALPEARYTTTGRPMLPTSASNSVWPSTWPWSNAHAVMSRQVDGRVVQVSAGLSVDNPAPRLHVTIGQKDAPPLLLPMGAAGKRPEDFQWTSLFYCASRNADTTAPSFAVLNVTTRESYTAYDLDHSETVGVLRTVGLVLYDAITKGSDIEPIRAPGF
jgi:hypothetical protein